VNIWNWIARMIAVPLVVAIVGIIVFVAPSLYGGGFSIRAMKSAMPLFAIVGAVMGLVVGCPLVYLIDALFARWRFRYLVFGVLGGVVGWLLLEGAFFTGSWGAIWTNSSFWKDWAPIRFIVFSMTGLLSGLFYWLLVSVIDKFIPSNRRRGFR